jgi:primary-amine oxidase
MLDGLRNSVVESDLVPLPDALTGSAENWAGNAFVSQEYTLRTAGEGAREYDFAKDRRWTIVNTGRRHHASDKPTGYVLGYRGTAATLLAKEGSWVLKRAGFAGKSLWVVKDAEDGIGGRMWPAGRYVPQTKDVPEDSVLEWAKGDESIEDEDIVLFLTLGGCYLWSVPERDVAHARLVAGVNHVPRPEDWPVYVTEEHSASFIYLTPCIAVCRLNKCASR